MKSPLISAFLSVFVVGCAHQGGVMPPSIDGTSLREGILAMKSSNPGEFAARCGWIDFSDGVNAREAGCIAYLYFHSSGWLCGGIGRVEKVGKFWECEFLWGYAGAPINPIYVDAKSGAVWQPGNERIDDIRDLLRIQTPDRPNKSLEPTAAAVTHPAGAGAAPAAAAAHP